MKSEEVDATVFIGETHLSLGAGSSGLAAGIKGGIL